MIDSAIDTGFASSDDDAASVKSSSAMKPMGILRFVIKVFEKDITSTTTLLELLTWITNILNCRYECDYSRV